MLDGTWADWFGKLLDLEPGELAVGVAAVIAGAAALRMFWVQLPPMTRAAPEAPPAAAEDGTESADPAPVARQEKPALRGWHWLPGRNIGDRPPGSLSSLVFNLMAAAALAGTLVVSLTIGTQQQDQAASSAGWKTAFILQSIKSETDNGRIAELQDEIAALKQERDALATEMTALQADAGAALRRLIASGVEQLAEILRGRNDWTQDQLEGVIIAWVEGQI